jgi:hypothetical protein
MLLMWSIIIKRWIVECIEADRRKSASERQGLSQAGLGRAIGIDDPSIMSRILHTDQKLDLDLLPKIISYIGQPLPVDVPIAREKIKLKLAPVVGQIKKSTWQENGDIFAKFDPPIPVNPSEDFKDLAQYAYEITGDSAAQLGTHGSYLICADYAEVRPNGLTDGDIAVVKETVSVHAGKGVTRLSQLSVRRVEQAGVGFTLKSLAAPPDSDLLYEEGEETVKMQAYILAIYKPTRKY